MPDRGAIKAIPPTPPRLILRSVLVRDYVHPGWNRRGRNGRLRPVKGWRLALHRTLWGFSGLVYIDAPFFTPFGPDGRWRDDLEALGFMPIGVLHG